MKRIISFLIIAAFALGGSSIITAQNSLPAPGAPVGGGGPIGGPGPGPGPGMMGPAMMGGGPIYGGMWGGPWSPGWYGCYSPTVVINTPATSPAQEGRTHVVAHGYDAYGVYRSIPLKVAYKYNGNHYEVAVLDAWDPWTDKWNKHLEIPAIYAENNLKGVHYDYYVPLSTGTYYFNL